MSEKVERMKRQAVFLDRDGVINVENGEYICRSEELCILAGVLEAVAALTRAGWAVVVFTNQSGVGRGYMSADALDAVHDYLRCAVAKSGGQLTAIYACPHHPEAGCECRKPKPGMLLQAAREHNIDLTHSYAVGDTPRDIAAGRAAGCQTVLVLSGHTHEYSPEQFPLAHPNQIFTDLPAFTHWLLSLVADN
jgi:D-glycero-D-manno-heptose 1,7-bisphosphate phosphatase